MKPAAIVGLEGHNPLGLFLQVEEWPAGLTKGELAKRVLPGTFEFDFALPQEWLNAQCQLPYGEVDTEKYGRIVSRCVWAYPKEAGYIGCCLDLVSGEVWI